MTNINLKKSNFTITVIRNYFIVNNSNIDLIKDIINAITTKNIENY